MRISEFIGWPDCLEIVPTDFDPEFVREHARVFEHHSGNEINSEAMFMLV